MSTIELDTFSKETDVMWRGFVASAVAAVALQWVNPFETSKLVLFQVRGFELPNGGSAQSTPPGCKQHHGYLESIRTC